MPTRPVSTTTLLNRSLTGPLKATILVSLLMDRPVLGSRTGEFENDIEHTVDREIYNGLSNVENSIHENLLMCIILSSWDPLS